jgi:hypothetical protein
MKQNLNDLIFPWHMVVICGFILVVSLLVIAAVVWINIRPLPA